MVSKYRVFVSSTSDFGEERRTIHDELTPEYDVYNYNSHMPAGMDARGKVDAVDAALQDALAESDLLLALVGDKYGSPVKGTAPEVCRTTARSNGRCVFLPKGGQPSFVEWELSFACKRGIEISPFLRPQTEAVEAPQAEFRMRLQSAGRCVSFDCVSELRQRVKQAVSEWRSQMDKELRSRARHEGLMFGFVAGASAVLAGLFVAIFVLFLLGTVSARVVVPVMFLCGIAIACGAALVWSRPERLNRHEF